MEEKSEREAGNGNNGSDQDLSLREKQLSVLAEARVDAFEHCTHGIAIGLPGSNTLLTCNPAFARLQGRTVEEIRSMPILSMYDPAEHEYVKRCIAEADRKGNIRYESRMVRKDGTMYPVQMDVVSVTDTEGQVIYRVATQQDISDRMRFTEELSRTGERFSQIAAQSRTVLWEVDANGLYTYISPMSMKVWGYSPEELVGLKHYYDIHPEPGREEFRKITREVFEKKESFINLVNPIVSPDGKILWMSTNGIPVLNNQGQLLGYRGADNDITELKNTEAALKANEEALNQAQVLAGMGSWEYDLISGSVTWSRNICTLYGFDPAQPPSFSQFYMVIYPEDRHIIEALMKEIPRPGETTICEFRIRTADGKLKWMRNNVQPVLENRRIVSLKGVNIEITAQKEAEDTILKQKNRLNAIIHSVPDIFFVLDSNGIFEEYYCSNPSVLLVPENKIIGYSITNLKIGPDPELHLQKLRESLREMKLVTYEYTIPGETTTHWEARVSPIEKDKVAFVIRDITQKMKTDLEMKKLSVAIEQSPVSIVITDLKANIVYVNPAFTQISGYSWFEIIGKNISILKSGKTADSVYKDLWTKISAGKEWSGELVNRKKNGVLFWEHVSINPIHDETGRITNYLAIKQDITERKETEERIGELNASLEKRIQERTSQLAEVNMNLRKEIEERIKAEKDMLMARKEAEEANRAKSVFLANMSHEIRTPMNAILGYSELLGSLIDQQPHTEYLNSIKTSGRTLLSLINDILDLSKIEAGRLELEYDFINSEPFFSDFGKIFEFKVSEKGLRFRSKIADNVPPSIRIDSTRLRQVILNLLSNAVRFTEKGEISLLVSASGFRTADNQTDSGAGDKLCDLEIIVEDTGIGIDKDFHSAIFGSFFQVKGKMSHGGTGLGLAITQRLVQMMQGTITLRSRVGSGTAFIIKIPDISYVETSETLDIASSVVAEEIIFEKATVLVVDDIYDNRRFLIDVLSRTGFSIFEAESGADALGLLEKLKPDLIISDIRMPGMSGFELLDKIQGDERLRHIPVIAYSASVMKEQKERIKRSRFAGLLIKPVQISDLYAELMKHLPYERKELPTDGEDKLVFNIQEVTGYEELLKELEGPCQEKWSTFRVRQPIGEIMNFGRELNSLGTKHNCTPLRTFGENLIHSAYGFNIEIILKLLNQYPGLVRKLKIPDS
jgi:PAS domain S-box-containing protein